MGDESSTWSFGAESPMKFPISDELAELYNQAAREFFKAQERFKRKHNRDWDPINEPIQIKWSRKQKKAWGKFAEVFNRINTEQGPFHENDIMDDYLVKNVGVAVAAAMAAIPLCISRAADAGAWFAIYGPVLRGALKGALQRA